MQSQISILPASLSHSSWRQRDWLRFNKFNRLFFGVIAFISVFLVIAEFFLHLFFLIRSHVLMFPEGWSAIYHGSTVFQRLIKLISWQLS